MEDTKGLALYVHWPFCLSKCPYCDFNSHVRDRIDQGRWAKSYLVELDHYGELTRGRTVTSVFFGGGTPSLMEPGTVGAVLDRAARWWHLPPDVEVTLEANPTSVEADRFAGFRSAGVNRVSLGVQALNDRDLSFLGRGHSAAEAMAAVKIAHRCFDRVSFDLIYARPGQSVAAWEEELGRALTMAGEHLSVYQLTIEPGTAFHAPFTRGDHRLPPEEIQADLYEATQAMLAGAGLPAYEISNHACPGAECRHNLTYWRYGDYAGVGPGAHGRLTLDGEKFATRGHRAPEVWLERVDSTGCGGETPEPIDPAARVEELLMMGLRLTEGVARSSAMEETGRDLLVWLDPAGLDRLVAGGFLEITDTHLRATTAGLQRLNAVLGALTLETPPG